NRRHDDADRARPLLHPAARARPGTRAHHDPELHARDDRRARRAVRARARRGAGALVLRPRADVGGAVVPSSALRSHRATRRGRTLAPPLHPAPRGGRGRARRGWRTRSDTPRAGWRGGAAGAVVSITGSHAVVGEPRRTKIVATIGPATRSVDAMDALIRAGADVFRLNFSHGTPAEHAENVSMAREAARRSGKEIGLLGDLPGPKLRLGEIAGGYADLAEGSDVTLAVGADSSEELLP